jgi:hypothetical protein
MQLVFISCTKVSPSSMPSCLAAFASDIKYTNSFSILVKCFGKQLVGEYNKSAYFSLMQHHDNGEI